ncbi:MAG: AAA family ATPase [Euryarchaeota archaeon]|nr:AAA family ATPase [Euryarchaeota archaeon]
MWINSVKLRNIKSYSEEEISFRRGVNGISGENGAGKTTILESIGFALFDHLPYSKKHFLRKGTKSGEVMVYVIASDEVEYTIVRSVKGDYRVESPHGMLVSGKTDVQDWVVENLFDGAINSGDLSSIFENAVGVPQGTFTTSFLSTPTVRKKVFDSILRVDEYRKAFENLSDVVKIVKTEIDGLEKKHHELKGSTANYDELKGRFEREKTMVLVITENIARLVKQLGELQRAKDDLGRKKESVEFTRKELEKLGRDVAELRKDLATAKKQFEEASDAKKIIDETCDLKGKYLESQKKLKELDGEKTKRNRLEKQMLNQENKIKQMEQELEKKKNLSEELENHRKVLKELEPRVKEQKELEDGAKAVEDLTREIDSLQLGISDLEKEKELFEDLSKDLRKLETTRTEIEPLVKEQKDLEVAIKAVEDLTREIDSLQSDINDLETKKAVFENLSKDCRKLETEQTQIEPLIRKADELKQQKQKTAVKKSDVQDKIKSIRKNKREIGETNRCPILEGVECAAVTSFSDYFEEKLNKSEEELKMLKGELARTEKELKGLNDPEKRMTTISSEISRITGQLALLSDVKDQLEACNAKFHEHDSIFSQKYANYLTDLPDAAELHAKTRKVIGMMEKRIKELNSPEKRMTTISSEISRITGQLTSLLNVKDQLEARNAKLHEHDSIFSQEYANYLTDLHDAAELPEKTRKTRELMAEQLKELGNPEKQASNMETLLDARTDELNRIKIDYNDLNGEKSGLFEIKLGLSEFSDLDSRENGIRQIMQDCEPHYRKYLQNETNAGKVGACRSIYDDVNRELSVKKQENDHLTQTLAEQTSTFDEVEFERVKKEHEARNMELGSKKTEYGVVSRNLKGLKKDVDGMELMILEKEGVRRKCESKNGFLSYIEFIRTTLKDSAQLIAGRLIKNIGEEANRIYCELIDDYTQELRWTHDYAVLITEHGEEKEFNQLSGGEQMAASLAVRFALLKILSGCDVVFLDEPTQNMDEMRREKLSEQILNISGFKQIFVISHDDTFNEKYEHVIRVEKIDGKSRVVGGDVLS